jgi:predicted Zn-dependent protease with MMP-like domain
LHRHCHPGDDFPTDDVLEAKRAETEFDLLGLFQGVGLPFRSESAPMQMPNIIWLYRRPILDYWAEHNETLSDIVRHVLIHEIGHHFGLSDAAMELSSKMQTDRGRAPQRAELDATTRFAI